jgi:protein gp37
MAATKIEWCDTAWNPIRGCSMAPGSEAGGCLNCYAARQAARNLPGMRSPTTGKPFAVLTKPGPRWTGHVELIESKLREPLTWKKPRRVFVNSMSDLFHESLPFSQIARVIEVIDNCPNRLVFFLVLTKRAKRMYEFMTEANRDGRRVWPPPNLALGVSCEDQKTFNERSEWLLKTPAAIRFLSLEPLLGPIDASKALDYCPHCDKHGIIREGINHARCDRPAGISWVIAGGESGPGARPMNPAWARSLRDQCQAARVPFFFKQWGEWIGTDILDPAMVAVDSGLGYKSAMKRVGKKAAGRRLDGREWNETPWSEREEKSAKRETDQVSLVAAPIDSQK